MAECIDAQSVLHNNDVLIAQKLQKKTNKQH